MTTPDPTAASSTTLDIQLVDVILVRLIRRARLVVTDDGHLFLVNRALEVIPVVRGFLAATAPRTA